MPHAASNAPPPALPPRPAGRVRRAEGSRAGLLRPRGRHPAQQSSRHGRHRRWRGPRRHAGLALRPSRRLCPADDRCGNGPEPAVRHTVSVGGRRPVCLAPLPRQQILHPLWQPLQRIRSGETGVHVFPPDGTADGDEPDRSRRRRDLVGHVSEQRPGIVQPGDARFQGPRFAQSGELAAVSPQRRRGRRGLGLRRHRQHRRPDRDLRSGGGKGAELLRHGRTRSGLRHRLSRSQWQGVRKRHRQFPGWLD